MSAEEAWREWDTCELDETHRFAKSAFIAGYRRALEDTADSIEAYGDGCDAVQDDAGATAVAVMSYCWDEAERLREQASLLVVGESE